MDKNDLLSALWVEKHRPKNLSDVVLPDDQREFLKKCIENGEIPHLLFMGPPGSGKCHEENELIEVFIED